MLKYRRRHESYSVWKVRISEQGETTNHQRQRAKKINNKKPNMIADPKVGRLKGVGVCTSCFALCVFVGALKLLFDFRPN